jgi:hypothetical protein
MKHSSEYPPIDVEETLSLMPAWVKEKERRYHLQQKIAKRAFSEVIEYLFGDKKKTSKKKR